MKKLSTLLLVFVAMMSFGGILAAPVYADQLTPAEAAALTQSLNSMKAQLLELQTQAAAQAAQGSSPAVTGETMTLAPAASASLSPSDAAAVQTMLVSLTSALTSLQASIAANPQSVAANAAGVDMALKSIGTTLAAISTSLGASASAPVAMTAPAAAPSAAPSPAMTAPAAPEQSAGAAMAAPSISVTVPSSPANADQGVTPNVAAPETAQVSSAWSWKSLNWPFITVGILVVVAIGLWLFWPSDNEAEDDPRKNAKKGPKVVLSAPKNAPRESQPQPQVQPQPQFRPQVASAPQTPLAAVSTPVEKANVTTVVTPARVVRPQEQQQRRPA